MYEDLQLQDKTEIRLNPNEKISSNVDSLTSKKETNLKAKCCLIVVLSLLAIAMHGSGNGIVCSIHAVFSELSDYSSQLSSEPLPELHPGDYKLYSSRWFCVLEKLPNNNTTSKQISSF